MDFAKIVHSINLASPNWDLLVFIVFLAGIYLYIFRWGKDKSFLALLSAYISLAVMEKLSLVDKVANVKFENILVNKAVLFLALLAAVFWILSRSDFASVFSRGMKSAWFEILVISFLQIGLITSLAISFLPQQEIKNLSIFLRAVFVEDEAQAFWLVSPFLALLLLRGK